MEGKNEWQVPRRKMQVKHGQKKRNKKRKDYLVPSKSSNSPVWINFAALECRILTEESEDLWTMALEFANIVPFELNVSSSITGESLEKKTYSAVTIGAVTSRPFRIAQSYQGEQRYHWCCKIPIQQI